MDRYSMDRYDIETEDLDKLIKEAIAISSSPSRVIYQPNFKFESSLSKDKAVILGGIASPQFLFRAPDTKTEQIGSVPLSLQLHSVRLLAVDKLLHDISSWVPLLEQVARKGESLLVLANHISKNSLVAEMLIVNFRRGVLKLGIVELTKETLPTVERYGIQAIDSLELENLALDELPLAKKVICRKDATFLFMEKEIMSFTESIAVIQVGGRDSDEQNQRLLYVAERVRKLSEQVAL
ncbi:MAG: hypothetical protein ACFB16_09235 [Phormidesmis sp.]